MLPVLLALLISSVFSPSIAEEAQKGLRFGNTTGDHITWSHSDLTELETQLSVCTWVRRWFNSPYPVIIHYYPHTYGFLLGSRGNHNYVVGSHLNLRTEYGDIPDGEWFHVCMTWSSSDYTTTVYLNGEVAGSKLTRHRKIEGASGGKFAVGNVASSRNSNYILGGDLFKLNIFRKVLSLEEVKRMSASICSEEEIRLDAYRTLRWEDILLKPRSGSVTEIPMCTGSEGQAPAEQDQETEDDSTPQSVISDGILKRLEVSERKLAESEKQLAAVQTILAEILKKLNSTEQELADTKEDLAQSNEKLQAMTESWNQTLSELETAKKKEVYSRWDVLYSEKFLNKKLTKEMVQDRELESIGGLLGLFVGMNITDDVISYLKGRHEEDVYYSMITVLFPLLYLLSTTVFVEANSNRMEVLDDILKRLRAAKEGIAQVKANFSHEFEVAKSRLDRSNETFASLGNTIRNTQVEIQNKKDQLTTMKTNMVGILARLDRTEQDLAGLNDVMSESTEKSESIKESLNQTLSELETAKKKEVYSRWDVLYSEKFLNKKLTKEMAQSQELESTRNFLGIFVGMNITNDVIRYLKSRHEENMVCLQSGI